MLKKAVNISSCYGFDPIEKIAIEQKNRSGDLKEKKALTQKISKQDMKGLKKDLPSSGIISTLQAIVEYKLLPSDQPILVHHSSIVANKNENSLRFCLAAIGMNKSIAEALILKTACAILDDIGIREIQVSINSIGDKDSTQKFARELNSYLRKNVDSLPAQARNSLIKKDVLSAYEQLHSVHHPLEADLPQSIKFLSDSSRKHLSEVLEYLEIEGAPYEIDNFLIGSEELYSQVLFEIRNAAEANENGVSVLAKGGRYDEVSRRFFHNDIPTVGIVLEFEKKGIKEKELNIFKKSRRPKVYFIQLGCEAKLKSLHVIDKLRKANIELHHNLNNDKFGEQIALAQYLEVPVAIIMGHREAVDGTVIVRDMNTQFQNTVQIENLLEYLKEIKL
ncbi:MAG: His/Gly/Thr/Pro-type tRNA ligase C-terminal domain-containing protein [Candidatus Paceibacteria bacterium]